VRGSRRSRTIASFSVPSILLVTGDGSGATGVVAGGRLVTGHGDGDAVAGAVRRIADEDDDAGDQGCPGGRDGACDEEGGEPLLTQHWTAWLGQPAGAEEQGRTGLQLQGRCRGWRPRRDETGREGQRALRLPGGP
jgi:hypothetical protein